ncbi:MAG: nitroreductase [Pseudomonadales bacterium]|nr:nitroreductase [Pseudomonadales bacterium]
MNLEESFASIVANRRSVRAYTSEPVPQELLEKVFGLAQKAPSNCNTQPWITHVASGDTIEKLRVILPENMAKGIMSFDYPYNGTYQGEFKKRQHDAAAQLYDAVGITRDQKDKRQAVFMKNYEFFDAPHVAFLFLPEEFGLREAADVGMYAQTLMLSFSAHGLACCPQTALGFHANIIKEVLEVPEQHKLLFGISFGYEDKSADINNARVGRAPLLETTTFHN